MKFVKKLLLCLFLAIIVAASIIILQGYNYYTDTFKEKKLIDQISEITSQENFVKFDDLSELYVDAVIATEDRRFYDHGAIDIISIGRALFNNIKNGEFSEGGSTITQQVAKNIFFTQDKDISRKVAEIFAAYDLERNYSKNEIFELYVNTSYFGSGYYGIYEASYGYYNKSPKELNLSEASMLAGIPNAPSAYSPDVNPELASQRQQQVLRKMVTNNYISQEEADSVEELTTNLN